MKKSKRLQGSDIILNLKKIQIGPRDTYSSSTCGGGTFFCFGNTKYGWVEDPDLTGTIRVLKAEKKKGYYLFKIRFKKEKEDEYE